MDQGGCYRKSRTVTDEVPKANLMEKDREEAMMEAASLLLRRERGNGWGLIAEVRI